MGCTLCTSLAFVLLSILEILVGLPHGAGRCKISAELDMHGYHCFLTWSNVSMSFRGLSMSSFLRHFHYTGMNLWSSTHEAQLWSVIPYLSIPGLHVDLKLVHKSANLLHRCLALLFGEIEASSLRFKLQSLVGFGQNDDTPYQLNYMRRLVCMSASNSRRIQAHERFKR